MVARSLLCLIGLAVAAPASAGELLVDGYYRARGRAFSSLSLSNAYEASAGPAAWVQHRLWIAPRFVASDKVAVFTELRGLDGMTWGQGATQETNAILNQGGLGSDVPLIWTDELRPTGTSAINGLPAGLPDISIWRAWAEVHGKSGTWRFGRMPVHWGLGVWQNDGQGLSADYGDSADRVQWEHVFEDVFLRAAIEVNSNRLTDPGVRDMAGATVAAAWRTERLELGFNGQLKRTFDSTADPFTLFTGSMAFEAEVGNLHVGAEAVARVGNGALSATLNDYDVRGFGGVLTGDLTTEKWSAAVEVGFATGDDDLTDSKVRTFAFDRDYNVGILMFEQPMPVFTAAGGGQDLDHLISGNGIANAIFGRAHGTYALPEDLTAQVTVVGARTFQRPAALQGQNTYGLEVDLGLSYQATEHVDVTGTGAFFRPGSYYRGYRDDLVTEGLTGIVVGGQILGRVTF